MKNSKAVAVAAPAVNEPTQPTTEQLLARIAELERLAANGKARGTSMKISAKGGLSFYGVGRFPVTLYESQWRILGENMPKILEFLTTNSAHLAHKETAQEQATV